MEKNHRQNAFHTEYICVSETAENTPIHVSEWVAKV